MAYKCVRILSVSALCFIFSVSYSQTSIRIDSIYSFKDSRDGNSYQVMVFNNTEWMTDPMLFKTNDSWCYNGKKKNCKIYGRMYTWEGAVKACPQGWKLPTNDEWQGLLTYLGGDKTAGYFFDSADDSTGFNLEFGYPPNIYGRFADDANELHFWSASEFNANTAWQFFIIKDKMPLVFSSYISKNYHLNCLCVKNNDSVMQQD